MTSLSASTLGLPACVKFKAFLHAVSELPLPPGVPPAKSLPSLLLYLKPQPTSLSPDAPILLALGLPPDLVRPIHAKLLQWCDGLHASCPLPPSPASAVPHLHDAPTLVARLRYADSRVRSLNTTIPLRRMLSRIACFVCLVAPHFLRLLLCCAL